MSTSLKYISIDSTYRNRNLYPNPHSFQVLFSDSGMKDRITAVDPISDYVPIISFNTQFDVVTTANKAVAGTIVADTGAIPGTSTIGNITSNNYVVGKFPTGSASSTVHVLQTIYNYYQGAVLFDTVSKVRSRILEYTFLEKNGTDDIAQFKLETALTTYEDGNGITIANPTEYGNSTYVFVPAGIRSENRYINYYLYNDTLSVTDQVNRYSRITAYNAITKILTLDTPLPIADSSVQLSIRKELPFLGQIQSVTNTITMTLPSSFSTYPLVGGYIRILSGAGSGTSILRINTATSTPVITVNGSFTGLTGSGQVFEFMPFTRDNCSPLVYSGSMLSQQEVSCYEIELVDLILPNQLLSINTGGFISEHQYVFVELSNTNSPSTNVIYSNNPHARNMLFKAAVPDILYPLITPFVRLLGTTDVKQTVKFKPNDNLQISVRLPNGEVITSDIPDTQSPLPPLNFLQLTVQFSIRKVN